MVSGTAVKRVKCTAVSLLSLEERPEKTSNHTVLLSQSILCHVCVCVCVLSLRLRRTSQLLNCLYQRHRGVRRRHDMLLLLSHLSLVQLVRVITHTSLFSFRVAIVADWSDQREKERKQKTLAYSHSRTAHWHLTHICFLGFLCVYVYLYPREKEILNTLALIHWKRQSKPSQPTGSHTVKYTRRITEARAKKMLIWPVRHLHWICRVPVDIW